MVDIKLLADEYGLYTCVKLSTILSMPDKRYKHDEVSKI